MNGRVQDLLEKRFEESRELGVQVAACLDGELVIDTWAGVADLTGRPVDGRTLFPVLTMGNGIGAAVVHILADRGDLRYDVRVAELWPAFGACGKHHVTVGQVLEHRVGLPSFPAGLAPDDLTDEDGIAALIADQPLGSRPDSLTFGYLIDHIVRGATGRTLPDVVSADLARPLGIEDELFVTPPDRVAGRLADLQTSGSVGRTAIDAFVPRRIAPPGRSWAMSARLPFAVTTTARAVARLYGALAAGGAPLMSERAAALATRIRFDGPGGSTAYADPSHELSFAFLHNQLSSGLEPAAEVAALVREVLAAGGDLRREDVSAAPSVSVLGA